MVTYIERRKQQGGQTLIIAIIIIGVLLILGVAFSILVSQSVNLSAEAVQRQLANDLAKAGAELAHERMLNGSADTAIQDTNPVVLADPSVQPDFTKDPDALYLRPGSFLQIPTASGLPRIDRGGPDGRGPFSRFEFDRGRALVRVLYEPSDYDAFAEPTGALRQPGKARRYLVIESIGRPGRVTVGGRIDPTRQLTEAVQYQNYGNSATLQNELARMHNIDSRVLPSRKMLAFATIGIGDDAMFITDINDTDQPAELGVATQGSGASFDPGMNMFVGNNPVQVGFTLGRVFPEPNQGAAFNWRTVPGLGGLRSNTSLVVHGNWDVALNAGLGESISVAGEVRPANDAARINLSRTYYDVAVDQWRSDWLANPSTVATPYILDAVTMDSNFADFSTVGSSYRDSYAQPDNLGYPRYVRPISAPLIDRIDPQGRDQYYVEITKYSGRVIAGRNTGEYGYGSGVYVDYMNPYNLQRRNDDERNVNASNALVDLWFNPNARDNTTKAGAWEGPYFVPDACYLRLLPDGFVIVRPGQSGEQQNPESAFWRDPATGNSTGQSSCRFRLRTIGGQTYILNGIEQPGLINQPGALLNNSDFTTFGRPFEGVIYFEGDVRVRGVIPTHHQITVLSMGNVYVDGSITKGVVNEFGGVINEPSRSMISLLARDHLAVNTTQFFAPVPNDIFDTKDDSPLPDTPTPIELGVDGQGVDPDVMLQVQLLMQMNPDPAHLAINPFDPTTWRPLALNYAAWTGPNSVGAQYPVFLNLVASANDSGPSYVSAGITPQTYADSSGSVETAYLFSRTLTFGGAGSVTFNAADPFFTPGPKIPIYGLGDPNINVFPKFESIEFPLVYNANWTYNAGVRKLIPNGGNPEGLYQLSVSDETHVRLRNNAVGTAGQKEFLVARTAVTPHDVRIEASLYAQYGSFYVIPGAWFNMNTDDSRVRYEADVLTVGVDEARRLRFERFGNTPQVPFSNEPLDVKVEIIGAVSMNMPAPMARQTEWMSKWGWIPYTTGATGVNIPWQHVPAGYTLGGANVAVPNFVIIHDPALAGASADGANPLRTDLAGRALPPTPRLPVSPTLVYFGEVNP